jgi:hypothetical protein
VSAGPDLYSVLNADLAPHRMASLLRLNDPDRGVLVCHPLPPGARDGQLASDLLHSLGKGPGTAGWPRRQAASSSYAKVWLDAERISEVVLVRADLFAASALSELVALARSARARTWLVFDDVARQRAVGERLGACAASRVRIAATRAQESGQTPARAKPWPSPSPWLARAAAAHLLGPDAFNEIDLRMYTALKAMSTCSPLKAS